MMDRKTLAIVVVCLAAGYWLASSPSSPVPAPAPQPDRPVLRMIAKLAKTFLWVALVAEPAPAEPTSDHRAARGPAIGDDGYPLVDHARGW